MDKAHNDYLELAAGLGLPAAVALWAAIAWLELFCLRGVFIRRRDRQYALVGFCAGILVAVHSSVDFSLQLPAIGLSYATLLGVGLAQGIRSQSGITSASLSS
jgi:O-antigen ligase